MTMTEFLNFLRRDCREHIKTGPTASLADLDASRGYERIACLIDTFLTEYAEHKKLSKQAEAAFVAAIENDNRKQFDDPVELIEHIRDIACRPPFFDSEHVSLSAINGFCMDYLHRHNAAIRKELIATAPF